MEGRLRRLASPLSLVAHAFLRVIARPGHFSIKHPPPHSRLPLARQWWSGAGQLGRPPPPARRCSFFSCLRWTVWGPRPRPLGRPGRCPALGGGEVCVEGAYAQAIRGSGEADDASWRACSHEKQSAPGKVCVIYLFMARTRLRLLTPCTQHHTSITLPSPSPRARARLTQQKQ